MSFLRRFLSKTTFLVVGASSGGGDDDGDDATACCVEQELAPSGELESSLQERYWPVVIDSASFATYMMLEQLAKRPSSQATTVLSPARPRPRTHERTERWVIYIYVPVDDA